MKLFITIIISFFCFELIAKETQYACSEWQIELTEYADQFFEEKRGTPFIAREFGNQVTLKDRHGVMHILDFIGNFNDIIKIYSSYLPEYKSTSIFFLRSYKDSSDKLQIMKFSYNVQWTYVSNCFKSL